jgi:hypothetical protein
LRGEGILPRGGASEELEPDLWGALPFQEVCQVLEDSKPLPHILIFRGIDTWQCWKDRPTCGREPENRIWVCSERLELSLERVQRLLEFRNIGRDAHLYLCGLHDMPTCWAFFENSSTPDVYAMIEVTYDPGLILLKEIAELLGIERLEEISSPHPRTLWNMLTIVEHESSPVP